MSKRHTITVDDKTFNRLKKYGKFGETYSSLIQRVLDIMDTG